MLFVELNIDDSRQGKNAQHDQRNAKVCHDYTSFVSSKQPKAKNSIVTINPPTNKAKWKVSGFAIGPITVIARMILSVS